MFFFNRNFRIIGLGLLLFSISILQCEPTELSANVNSFSNDSSPSMSSFDKIKGLSFVAPPNPFPKNPMPPIKNVGSNFIAVIPYAYTRVGEPKVHYSDGKQTWQWWGERPEGCLKTIELAKKENLAIMLKPQVYVPRSWTGDLDFPTEEEWLSWEASYEDYILPYAEIAEKNGLKIFCIGTEFKISSRNRPQFWRQLIKKVRNRYKGKLTYAANWDEYLQISFWDELDYIGVNAYFPLVEEKTPEVEALVKAWQPTLKALKDYSKKWDRPILFTEFGYLSVDHAASPTWELEKRVRQLKINEQAQANALDGLFSAFWQESFWAGGFLWKWFPNMQGHEGYPRRDYTPQDKIAETVLKKWYISKK